MEKISKLSQLPPVGYCFVANFFFNAGGTDQESEAKKKFDTTNKSVDIRFQKISGFQVSMTPETLEEGGQNLFTHRLPKRYNYENLILERGLVPKNSDISQKFNEAVTTFTFKPATVLVMLLNEEDNPVMAWAFYDAWPVSWRTSDLDANANAIVIETLELAYTRFQRIEI